MAIILAWKLASSFLDSVFGQPPQHPHLDANGENYKQFLGDLRRVLASGLENHGIPVLRNPSIVPDNQRFILVDLSNHSDLTVTLAIDVTNAYVVGYRVGNESFFFNDHLEPARSNVFTDTQQNILPFGGGYPPQQIMESISLGITPLNDAISRLHDSRNLIATAATSLRYSLIVIIQMVAEAARLRYVEQRVLVSIRDNQTFEIDACMYTLEHQWEDLSIAIQEATDQGVFTRQPIQLQQRGYQILNVDRVTEALLKNMALLLAKPNDHDELK